MPSLRLTPAGCAALRLVMDGRTVIFSKDYDPSLLVAAMAGKLVRYLVPDGEHVSKGGRRLVACRPAR
jgi:hypothetical protein